MVITKELLINEIKTDLINKAGISRLSFGNPRERERYLHITEINFLCNIRRKTSNK